MNLFKDVRDKKADLVIVPVLAQNVEGAEEITLEMFEDKEVLQSQVPEQAIRNIFKVEGCRTRGPIPADSYLTPFLVAGRCEFTLEGKNG